MAKDKNSIDIAPHAPFRRLMPMLITFAVFGLAGPWVLSAYWINTFSSVACLTMVAATVAMLYGQLGMVSLAQFALAGGGGWVCLRLIHGFGIPFEIALVIGAFSSGISGLVLGLPALRMRGLYLALLTLLVAAAFQVMVNVNGFPDGGPGWTGRVLDGHRLLIERPIVATSDEGYFRYVIVWLMLALSLIHI